MLDPDSEVFPCFQPKKTHWLILVAWSKVGSQAFGQVLIFWVPNDLDVGWSMLDPPYDPLWQAPKKKDLRIFDADYFGLNLILLDLLLGTTNPEILLLSSNFMTLVSPLSFSHCLVDENRGFLTIQQSVNKLIIVNGMFQTDPSIFPRGQH